MSQGGSRVSLRSVHAERSLSTGSLVVPPGEGLPFSDILSAERIHQVFDEAGASFAEDEENAVYTPAVTLWAFLSQVLFKAEQRSCLAAVSRVMVFLVAMGQKACSKNTAAYCRARAKLPTAAIRQLTTEARNRGGNDAP